MASKKYRNHSCESFCYVKMHVQQERLYFLFAFFFQVVIHGDCCDRKHPKQLFDSSKTLLSVVEFSTCTTISYRRIARFDAILKTYAANFMRIITASASRLSCLGPVFRPFTDSDQHSFPKLLRHIDVPTFS